MIAQSEKEAAFAPQKSVEHISPQRAYSVTVKEKKNIFLAVMSNRFSNGLERWNFSPVKIENSIALRCSDRRRLTYRDWMRSHPERRFLPNLRYEK